VLVLRLLVSVEVRLKTEDDVDGDLEEGAGLEENGVVGREEVVGRLDEVTAGPAG